MASKPITYPSSEPPPTKQVSNHHTPIVNKASSDAIRAFYRRIAFNIKKGFHDLLKREIGDSIYGLGDLPLLVFSDKRIGHILSMPLAKIVNNITLLPLALGVEPRVREASWAKRLDDIACQVEMVTGCQPKRLWTAISATKPMTESDSKRKPDLSLLDAHSPVFSEAGGVHDLHWDDLRGFGEEKGDLAEKNAIDNVCVPLS